MISEASYKDLIDSVDIVDFLSQYTKLELRDDGEYWGISCLSDHDTDPSFSVNRENQIFYDFSSHKGGTVLDFIMAYYRIPFKKAVEFLSNYIADSGITMSRTEHLNCVKVLKKYAPPKKQEKEVKYKDLGSDFMQRYEDAPEMLKGWVEEGITESALDFWQVKFDPMSERIVFPIRDINGNIVNVCGRTVDPEYKEKKLRKYTYFFPLGRFDMLYGFWENASCIREKGEIILFEGPKSVMKAWGWGVRNCAALCTSRMNIYQFELLLKLRVRVVFALDTDANIYKDDNIKKLRHYTAIENVINRDNLLGEKMAPVDAGFDVWKELYERRAKVN